MQSESPVGTAVVIDPRVEGVYVTVSTYPPGEHVDSRRFYKIERVNGNGTVDSLELVESAVHDMLAQLFRLLPVNVPKEKEQS